MVAHGALTDAQLSRDGPVVRAEVGRKLADQLAFARGQLAFPSWRIAAPAISRARQLEKYPASACPIEPNLAPVHMLDCLEQHVRGLLLMHDAARASEHRALVHRQVAQASQRHHGFGARDEFWNDIETAVVRLIDREHDHVRAQLVRSLDRLAETGGLADHFHAGLFAVDETLQAPEHDAIVIDEQDANRPGRRHAASRRRLVPVTKSTGNPLYWSDLQAWPRLQRD